jgi:hypothetical protein
MEVIDFSNNTQFAKRRMKDQIQQKSALNMAKNTNAKMARPKKSLSQK